MKKIITYIIATISIILLAGCETIRGEYKQGKGCNGLVNGIEIKTSCEEWKEYFGKTIEIVGTVIENKCNQEFPQCFSGKQMKNIKSIRIVD